MRLLHRCDGCNKMRTDVRSCGKDSNGDPDAPDLCFFCRKDVSKGKFLRTDLKCLHKLTIAPNSKGTFCIDCGKVLGR